MARDHGRVLCKIWQDRDFKALPRTAQALYMQLLSQPGVNNAGVLPLQVSKWAKGCNELTAEDIWRDLAVLSDRGFIVVDTDSEEVLIRSFIRNDGGMAHKYIFKNALTCAEAVESPLLRKALAIELYRLKRPEATRVADVLAPDSEPDSMPSESDSNAEVNPSESHSNPIEIASESEMAFESHSNHCGVGEGEGVGESPVVGHLGGVARAHTRDAHARETTPTPTTTPSTPFCDSHPGGTPDPCRACADTRRRYEATEAARLEAETARRIAEARAQSEAAQQRAADRRAAIDACGMCGPDGYRDGAVCDHDPDTVDRARRGMAAVRAALAQKAAQRAESDSPSPDIAEAPENAPTATLGAETTDQEPAHA